MKASRRHDDIDYTILRFPMTIEGPNGTVRGNVGDYLITEGERQYFMRPDDFTAAFSPQIDPPAAPPTYVPVPVPYPVYPQPSYPRYWYGTITASGSSQTVPLGSMTTAINQGAVNAQLMHGSGTISGTITDANGDRKTATYSDGSYSIGD